MANRFFHDSPSGSSRGEYSCGGAQTVKAGDTVKVDYTGKLTDDTVFDSSVGKTPLEFTVGSGQMIKGFDNAVLGMTVGQNRTVTLPPEEAYGNRNDELIVTVNRSQLAPGTNPVVGQQLPVTRGDGSRGTVVVVSFNATAVTVDANHPLAGKTLIFDIKLVSITPKK